MQGQITFKAAVDIGGTNTKVFISSSNDKMVQFSSPSKTIFGNKSPQQAINSLVTLMADEMKTSESVLKQNITSIVFSVTGDIDSKGTVVSSDRLKEFSGSCGSWAGQKMETWARNALNSHVKVRALNDAYAHCFRSLFVEGALIQQPILNITLGTFPAISVASVEGDQIVLFKQEDWTCSTINNTPIYEVCKATNLLQQNDSSIAAIIQEAVKQCLIKYFAQFKWVPKTIVISGGISNKIVSFKTQMETVIRNFNIQGFSDKHRGLLSEVRLLVGKYENALGDLLRLDYYCTSSSKVLCVEKKREIEFVLK